MTRPGTYTATQVGERLGHSLDWFADHRAVLEQRHRFPPPLPLPGRPRWSRAQVDSWIRHNGEVPDAGGEIVEDDEAGEPLPSDWTKKLLARIHAGEGV